MTSEAKLDVLKRAYEEWMLNDFNLKKNDKNEVSEKDKEKVAKIKKDQKDTLSSLDIIIRMKHL